MAQLKLLLRLVPSLEGGGLVHQGPLTQLKVPSEPIEKVVLSVQGNGAGASPGASPGVGRRSVFESAPPRMMRDRRDDVTDEPRVTSTGRELAIIRCGVLH